MNIKKMERVGVVPIRFLSLWRIMHFKQEKLKMEEIIGAETRRIADKYKKDFLCCEDLIEITGLGRDNVRMMMKSKGFPVTKIGNRQVVSVVAFVTWHINNTIKEKYYG